MPPSAQERSRTKPHNPYANKYHRSAFGFRLSSSLIFRIFLFVYRVASKESNYTKIIARIGTLGGRETKAAV